MARARTHSGAAWLWPYLDDEDATFRNGVVRTIPDSDSTDAGRFDGIYGRVYSEAMAREPVRRAVAAGWGGAEALVDLARMAGEAASFAAAADSPTTLLDVPSGQGTMLRELAAAGAAARVIQLDLSGPMLERGARADHDLPPGLDVAWLQGDALDMPLRDGSVDAAISLNGLHVMPSPARFLAELARVLRPGGQLWMVTLVSGGGIRSRAILELAERVGILPAQPPGMDELLDMVETAGFEVTEHRGGSSFASLRLARL